MTINFTAPIQESQLKPRITVIGVGGAGGNAVNNMISNGLEGVEFIVANTDAQAISQSQADRSVQLGINITHGLGAGARPDMGRAAAEEAIDELTAQLEGSHMLFIAAGMGGGTGTGAAPVIARLAREQGMLTVGVVTKPFQFEGINRMRIADAGIEEMQQFVDTLIVIPNQNLFRVANEKTTFADAFAMADDVLHCGVRGVTDLMMVPGLINLDFADIRSVMSEMGKAMMGTGESDGEDRAKMAAEAAISNPLLDDVSMKGARGVLINITGGPDMTLFEVDEAANRIGDEVDPEANIIFGTALDPNMEGRIRVSVVATGIDADVNALPRPVLRVYSEPALTLVDDKPGSDAGTAEESAAPPPATMTEPAQVADTVALAEPEAEAVMSRPLAATGTEGMIQDSFIPPPAVQPGRAEPAPAMPDPRRAADPDDGAEAEPKPPRTNLFRRMTGVGLGRRKAAKTTPDTRKAADDHVVEPALSAPPKDDPEPEVQMPEMSSVAVPVAAPSTAPMVAAQSAAAAQPAPEQPGFDIVEKAAPAGAAQSEEDLLDIPAFLRRQAN